jgi:hypothetical protein
MWRSHLAIGVILRPGTLLQMLAGEEPFVPVGGRSYWCSALEDLNRGFSAENLTAALWIEVPIL